MLPAISLFLLPLLSHPHPIAMVVVLFPSPCLARSHTGHNTATKSLSPAVLLALYKGLHYVLLLFALLSTCCSLCAGLSCRVASLRRVPSLYLLSAAISIAVVEVQAVLSGSATLAASLPFRDQSKPAHSMGVLLLTPSPRR